jgi:hypothetical protein
MKTCGTCRHTLPLADFGKNSRYADNLQRDCRDCSNAKTRARYAKKPEQYAAAKARRKRAPEQSPAAKRARHLRSSYGMTEWDVQFKIRLQGGGCAICGQPAVAVDHDHQTGEVRGILCHRCNLGLGHFRDNMEMMRKAIEYLEFWEMLAADAGAVR